ncbi:MAG TPA: elongation factor G [Bacteroides sp.]|nr:elongation factor G [Bacteroides sp.]
MKTYQTNQVKNIALLGNSGSGKTTLAESMLMEGGVISRKGEVDQKTTASDFREIEQENQRSIYSSVLYTEYGDKKVNILDVPGADDFIGGVISSLRVSDVAVMLINSQNGVEVGTEIHQRYTEKYNIPVVYVINKCDHDHANFEKSLESLKERFGSKIAQLQFPVNAGPTFDSIVDVLQMKLYKYPKDGGKPEIGEIPDDLKPQAEELHGELVEKAAENDESLMELFFENDSLSEDEMRKGITTGLIENGISPVLCTSAEKDIGVGRLLQFITNVFPSPCDTEGEKTVDDKEIKCDPSGDTTLIVFKSEYESHIGEINYFKVLSGTLTEGMDLINNRTRSKERLSQLFAVAGKERNKVDKLFAGDIGATVKLKNTKTDNTLSTNQNIEMPATDYPEPKFRTAIRTLTEGDEEKLGEALTRIHEADPTVVVEYSKELKQIILGGQGEHHLNLVKWHLDNTYKVETEFLTPKIPYRETITKVAQADYRHKKQSGGAGQFGEVYMIIEPYHEGAADPTTFKAGGKDIKVNVRNKDEIDLEWGGKLLYYNCIVGGSIDARFLPAILKGIMEKMEEGPLTGSYARDIRVFVYDGKMHPVDSNEISFKLAGRNAFREAFKIAGPKIMEPVYDVEVLVPGDRMGDVMSDLQGRRAIVQGMSSEKGFEKIAAKVPLAEMNKYSTALSSLTGGRAMYSMKFAEYAQVPPDIQEQLLKSYEAKEAEE